MSTMRKPYRRCAPLVSAVVSVTMLAGCAVLPLKKSIDIDPAEVVQVEMFQYSWGDETSPTRRATIDPQGYGELSSGAGEDARVSMFTDMPTTAVGEGVAQKIAGKEALGVRYHLADGSTKEITRVFVGYQDVVVFWPDGSVRHTEWGSPRLVDEVCVENEFDFITCDEVPASERPEADLPS